MLRIEDLARALLDLQSIDFEVRPRDRPRVHDVDMNYPELPKRVYANSPDAMQLENQLRLNSLDLEEALSRLSERSRAVVWLHDVEGYTHEDIADMMGMTVSFSKSQLARAHARLKQWLGEEQA